MSDYEETWMCEKLIKDIACIQRCITRTVEEIHNKSEEINDEKLIDTLEEVQFLREILKEKLHTLKSRLISIHRRKTEDYVID